MTALYPEIEPYDHGMLEASDDHRVYWETCGNPDGKPAVVLHGGPGSGCSTGIRRYFDPSAYRVVLFDQRGCGRSTPHASEPDTDLSANTTDHLVADLERLRRHLGIDHWLLYGGSWGSILGLVYAERFPGRVTEIVLTGVATGRRTETDMLTRGLGELFPGAWTRFRDAVPVDRREGDLIEQYAWLLADPEPTVHEQAARDWCDWESVLLPEPRSDFEDPAFRLAFARLVTHYWRHGYWLDEGAVLRDADALTGIPGFIGQGAMDVQSNMTGAPWLLTGAWPDCQLVIVDDIGHSTADETMRAVLVGALDRFGRR